MFFFHAINPTHIKHMKTIDELNSIQAEWMALDSNAPKEEQDRVCALMESTPKNYISINASGLATAMFNHMPLNQPMPLEDVINYHGKHMESVEIAWKCPNWVNI